MPYEPTTNFRDSNGVDLGKKLVTKDYLLTVYGSILESLGVSGLTVTPALWTWGAGGTTFPNVGQLGTNNSIARSTPVTTFLGGINWKQVSCSGQFAAAIKTDGSLWTWGLNSTGQLGINNSSNRSTPVTTFAGGFDWKSVDCGINHTTSIKTDGSLWVWGRNAEGQLGINNTVIRSTPVTTFAGGFIWKFVSGGSYHTASIKSDGSLWTWGNNDKGQLGINNSITRSTPVTTFSGGFNWKFVSAGGYTTSGIVGAIKTDGSLWTWGLNGDGQLGINNLTLRSTPVTTFSGGFNWKFVSCASNHMVGIKTDGTLWNWGDNRFGQMGDNTTTTRSTPVTTFTGAINWKSIDCGDFHTTAIKTDGSLWVWGQNSYGPLGINNTTNRSIPVTTFLGGNDWKQSSGGYGFTVAIESVDYI